MNRKFLGLLVVAAVFAAGYWLYVRGDESWRQKMVVTVSTPTGEVSGEAVTSVYVHKNDLFKDGAPHQFSIKGEAIIVDLGAGRYFFALLSSSGSVEHVAKLAPTYLSTVKGVQWLKAIETTPDLESQIVLPENLYPTLVTFTDINHPKSVKEVKPNDLATIFGAGYSLKSITLEITNEPVTQGRVSGVLGWLYDQNVMENPGWAKLSIDNRRAISGLVSDFRKGM